MKQVRLSTIDLPTLMNQLSRGSIGFDRFFEDLSTFNVTNTNNYPPHDIVKHSDLCYTIEIACAGFKEDELSISVEDGLLTISGNQLTRNDREYVHQGISARSFTKTLRLAEHVEIGAATYDNGLLIIEANIVLPEELKPRQIPITNKNAAAIEVKE